MMIDIIKLKPFFFGSIKTPQDFFDKKENINYIDIGASDVKNKILYFNYNFINFFLFEPDKRAIKGYLSSPKVGNFKLFDKGLWSKKTKKMFYEYKNQASSSFFKANINKLKNYNIGTEIYKLQKKYISELDNLDNLLKKKNIRLILLKLIQKVLI